MDDEDKKLFKEVIVICILFMVGYLIFTSFVHNETLLKLTINSNKPDMYLIINKEGNQVFSGNIVIPKILILPPGNYSLLGSCFGENNETTSRTIELNLITNTEIEIWL